jgi:hypothetical protein
MTSSAGVPGFDKAAVPGVTVVPGRCTFPGAHDMSQIVMRIAAGFMFGKDKPFLKIHRVTHPMSVLG